MQLQTVEVELKDGKVTPIGAELLPAEARALLTLLPAALKPKRNPFEIEPDPKLRVTFLEDPTAPLTEEDWPGMHG